MRLKKRFVENKSFLYTSILMFTILFFSQVFYGTLNLYKLNSLLGLVVFMLLYLVLHIRNIKIDSKRLLLLLTLFIVNLGISLFGNRNDVTFIVHEALVMLCFFILLPSFKVKNKHLLKILKIINCFVLGLVFLKYTDLFTSLTQYSHVFYNKNSWAQAFIIPIVISFYLYKDTGKKIYLAFVLLYYYEILMSFSRTALIASIFFVCIYILLTSKQNLKRNSIIIILLFSSLLFLMYYGEWYTFLEMNLRGSGTSTFTGREFLWKFGLETFLENPLFGIGRGEVGSLLGSSNLPGSLIFLRELHSYYLELLVSGGIFSFTIIMYFLILPLKNSINIYKKEKEKGAIFISGLVTIYIYMIAESFNPFLFHFNQITVCFFLLYIPVAYSKKRII